MKGLLLKDWYMMKKYCRTYLFIGVVFVAASVISNDNLFFVFYPCMLCGMIPVNLLAYDERSRWLQYSSTLPCSRVQMVTSKYLIGLFAQLVVVLAAGLAQSVKMAVSNTLVSGNIGTLMLLLLATATLSSAIPLPFIFKLGVEKGRTAYYAMIGFVCGASVLASRVLDGPLQVRPNGLLILLAAAGVGVYALSWFLSIRFYEKREI